MTSLQRFSPLSMAFGLQILVPLLIVLLAFSAFTGERERGTLRQLLSIGVQP
jgi:ABC-2 type transport system permease protein